MGEGEEIGREEQQGWSTNVVTEVETRGEYWRIYYKGGKELKTWIRE